MPTLHTKNLWRAPLLSFLLLATPALPAGVAQQRFDSPDAAIDALFNAVKSEDQAALRALFGPRSGRLVSSGDPVSDARRRETFVNAWGEEHKLVAEGGGRSVLVVGRDAWPMPIPLAKAGDGRWYFDTAAGGQEVLARRIGRNELSAIQVCLAIVDAQREYAALDPDHHGASHYAARFVSKAGRHDGLFWPAEGNDPPSPLGPLLAAASKEGYVDAGLRTLEPYHGYYYRLLTRQGRDAKGGAYDYLVRGRMVGGFALLAYPARYRSSGIKSFIANQDGVVYEKDLGRNTAAIAGAMQAFNPDASWKQP